METIRTVLDDETAARLHTEAQERGLEVEELIVALLVAASDRVDELLGDDAESTG